MEDQPVSDAICTVGSQADRANVYIVDDDAAMRKSLYVFASALGWASRPFAGGADFLDELPSLTPGPILLDIRMADMDGIEVLGRLKARGVNWPVIIMSGHGDIAIAVQVMKLGAVDFLEKPFRPPELEKSMGLALALLKNNAALSTRRVEARRRLAQLTVREDQVVNALIDGAANKQVAHRLGLSTRTIEMYRASALSKIGVKSIVEAATLIGSAA